MDIDTEYVAPRATPSDLTPRQLAVAKWVAKGYTDKRIAHELQMSQNTVRVHVVALAYRLHIPAGMNTRVMITRWWYDSLPELRCVAA